MSSSFRRKSKFRKTAKIVLDLIDVQVDRNVLQRQLYNAAKDPNSKELGRLLLNPEIDINYHYKYHSLYKYNIFQILCVQLIHRKNEKLDYESYRKEFLACGNIILSNGVDVRYKDNVQEYKAIDFAALTGELDLLEHVIRIHEKNGFPYTTRHLYCIIVKYYIGQPEVSAEHIKVMEYLMGKKVDINCFDHKTGEPAIYLAAINRFKTVVQLFIDNFPNVIDLDYYTDPNQKSARSFILKYHLYEGTLPVRTQGRFNELFKAIHENCASTLIESYRNLEGKKPFPFRFQIILLFRALNTGSADCFEFLFEEIVNHREKFYDILEVASLKGFYRIIDKIFDITFVYYGIGLIKKLVTIKQVIIDDANCINHIKCLQILLENDNLDLNMPDEYGVTILEYAIKLKNPKMINVLLKHGSSLVLKGNKQEYVSVVADINISIVDKYFDDCIIPEEDDKQMLKCMASKTSLKMQVDDFTLDYSAFLPPKLGDMNIRVPEMVVFDTMAQNSDYHPLLIHPLCLIFIAMKYHRLRYYFYFHSLVDLIFTISLNVYLLNYESNVCFMIAALIFGAVLILEFAVMVTFGKEYWYFFDHLWKLFLLVLTAFVVVLHFFLYKERLRIWIIQLYALVALISVANLFIILGNYVWFNLSVIMLKTIYISLFKAFFTYAVLLVAFSTCMHILFRDTHADYFPNYILSIFKTIIMTTGDLSLDQLDLPNRPFGYFIIFLFIFLITIALLNLLTGIAVSDIQTIQQRSRIYSQVQKVHLVSKVERVFNKYKTLKYFPWVNDLFLFKEAFDNVVLVDVDSCLVTVKGHKPHKIHSYPIRKLLTKHEDD